MIDSFTLSLCTPCEQAFVNGCNDLIQGHEDHALMSFKTSAKAHKEFFDAWFMVALLELKRGRVDIARQAFLRIVGSEVPFYGFHILRFMPRFRPMLNFFEDFTFHAMPTTGTVAAALARMYLIEGKVREAKKVIHPAFREYPDDFAVGVVWAQSMLDSDSPDEIINEIDMKMSLHSGRNEIELVLTFLIGQAYLMKGDFRSAISHLESVLHHGQEKNPRLMDFFRINIAKVYEKEGYLTDAFDAVDEVENQFLPYDDSMTVELKRYWLINRMETFRTQGIIKPIEFNYTYRDRRAQRDRGYLEFKRPDVQENPDKNRTKKIHD